MDAISAPQTGHFFNSAFKQPLPFFFLILPHNIAIYKINYIVNYNIIVSVFFRKKIPYNKPYEVTTMFKVKKQEHINKTFRMPVELVASLEELAAKKEVSLNQLVIQCCAYALAHLADDDS